MILYRRFLFLRTLNFAKNFNTKNIMEVITIENRAYQELMQKINQLIQISSEKPKEKEEKKDEWLDSAAVCQQLNISSRTLYRLQKERLISYSTLRGRYRYKQSDVEQVLRDNVIVSSPESFEGLMQSFPAYCKK